MRPLCTCWICTPGVEASACRKSRLSFEDGLVDGGTALSSSNHPTSVKRSGMMVVVLVWYNIRWYHPSPVGMLWYHTYQCGGMVWYMYGTVVVVVDDF